MYIIVILIIIIKKIGGVSMSKLEGHELILYEYNLNTQRLQDTQEAINELRDESVASINNDMYENYRFDMQCKLEHLNYLKGKQDAFELIIRNIKKKVMDDFYAEAE